jgi:L-arginine dehydrogenase
VIVLCTSSGTPVLDPDILNSPALITSISGDVARAHEVPPGSLSDMDVYCDHRASAPLTAGEMTIAAADYGWSANSIRGDLPELLIGRAKRPSYTRNAFFRSIGLGIEDVAMASAMLRVVQASI